jgi:hypothetical protein
VRKGEPPVVACLVRLFPRARDRERTALRGLGHNPVIAWLDANCGSDGWTMTPSSTRGVVNDVVAICFADVTLASAFVARWCAMQRVEIVDGVYQVRGDEPTPRIGAPLHRTPGMTPSTLAVLRIPGSVANTGACGVP